VAYVEVDPTPLVFVFFLHGCLGDEIKMYIMITAIKTIAGACSEDEKPVSNVHRSACIPACNVEHSLCHEGTCICSQGFEGTYHRGRLQYCEPIPLDVRQTGKHKCA